MSLRLNVLIFKILLRVCRYYGNLFLGEDMVNKGLVFVLFDLVFYIFLVDLYEEFGK